MVKIQARISAKGWARVYKKANARKGIFKELLWLCLKCRLSWLPPKKSLQTWSPNHHRILSQPSTSHLFPSGNKRLSNNNNKKKKLQENSFICIITMKFNITQRTIIRNILFWLIKQQSLSPTKWLSSSARFYLYRFLSLFCHMKLLLSISM